MYALVKPLLFALPAETAHALVLGALAVGGRVPGLESALRRTFACEDPVLETELWGLRFPNPLGLAAGMDKDGVALGSWQALGFGFMEAGTVTPRPQPGNERPRLFRLPAERALINRMGFNNAGAGALAERLARFRASHPSALVGVNLGKNRDTPLERAVEDYAAAMGAVAHVADYLTINVSSPNTPGLRDLQSRATLTAMAGELVSLRERMAEAGGAGNRRPPLLIKVAPELDEAALADVAAAAIEAGCDGLIAANTTLAREGLHSPHRDQAGGLSGRPLHARAVATVAALRRHTGGRLPLIGVGGIGTAEEAYDFIRAGASLVQLYTALVYRGPGLVREIKLGLAALLARDGFSSVAQAVGTQ